jgi:uncharacterized SAM-binding protein YcdF (DUF218 family)
MKNFHRQRQKHRFFYLAICAFILVLLSIIPVRLAIAITRAPIPQAIFTLGAVSDREVFTARFAQLYPSLEIWVSSGAPPDKAHEIFQTLGIPSTRVHIDRRAIDTVTNFTSLVADFKKRNFQHLYLITSDFHMRRAKAIATLVLGSQGIAFTPVPMPSDQLPKSEPWLYILRDSGRALLWIVTGRTGASLNPKL